MQRQRESSHVKREAETGVMLPQAEKHLQPPDARRDEEQFFRNFRGIWPW